LQVARQELSDALEQILKADEQYDALDTRKRAEISELMRQLEQAHEALEEVERKTQPEIVTFSRTIEELKDGLERKQEELQDARKEHEMVEMFRQEELASLRKELDDLTDLFVQIEQSRREDDERATARYEEMVRQKDHEIAELRKQPQNGGKLSASYGNGTTSTSKPYAGRGLTPSPEPGKLGRPASTSPEPHSPRSGTQIHAPSPSPSPSPQPSPSPSPTPGARTWGSTPAYSKPATSSTTTSTAPKWTPPPKNPTLVPPSTSTAASTTSAPKWTAPPKTTFTPAASTTATSTTATSTTATSTTATPTTAPSTTTSTSGTGVGQKPAWVTSKSSPAPVASTTAAPAVNYEGPLYSVTELRGMLKNPSSAFEGFDKTQIEIYLHDAEFHQLLGMSKTEYNKLPKWKQAPLKSKAKLF